jgi:hypothetical protein
MRRSPDNILVGFMQFGPHPRIRPEDQQPNTFATAAQRQYEKPGAPVLAGGWIAHHRPRAVIDLALFTQTRLSANGEFATLYWALPQI